MSSDLRVKLLLEDGDFRQRLDTDAKSIKELGDAATPAAQSLAQMTSKLIKQTEASTGYARQAKMLTKQITDLRINYEGLSEAEKQSDFGKNMLRVMDELSAKAANFADVAGDVQQSIKNMASDTAAWDALKEGISAASNAMQAYYSITALTGKENETLEQFIKKMAAAQSVANSIIAIGNSLQKQSALMVGVARLQDLAKAAATNIKTAAEVKSTVATKAATAAQAAFNVVAKANPYVLLATAVVAVGVALYKFSKNASQAAAEQKKLAAESKAAKEAMKKQQHEADVIGSKTSSLVGNFKALQAQWNSLKTVAEKEKWIKDNQSAFDQLNLSVWNVNDAYSVFVKNSDKVIDALKKIAKAEAVQELYKDALKEKITKWDARRKTTQTGDFYTTAKAGNTAASSDGKVPKEWAQAGISQGKGASFKWGGGQSGAGTWTLDQSGADKLNALRNKNAAKTLKAGEAVYQGPVDFYEKLMYGTEQERAEAEATLNSLGGTGVKPGTTTKTTKSEGEKYDTGTLADLRAQDEVLKKKLETKNLSKEEIDTIINQRTELQKQIALIEKKLGLSKEEKKANDANLKNMQKVSDKGKEAAGLTYSDVDKKKAGDAYKPTDFNQTEDDVLKDQLDNVKTLLNALEELIAKKQEAMDAIAEAGGDPEVYNALNQQVEELKGNFEAAAQQAQNLVDKINASNEAQAKFQKKAAKINKVGEMVGNVGSAFSSLGSAFESEGLNIAGIILEAVANVLAGYAAASAQAAQMGPWGWAAFSIAGLAQVAAVIAQIHSLSGYASGGIIQGSSTIGDYNLARVNSGEMILNQGQQGRLFSLLNGNSGNALNSGDVANVEFKIKGKDLVGVIANYSKQQSRL